MVYFCYIGSPRCYVLTVSSIIFDLNWRFTYIAITLQLLISNTLNYDHSPANNHILYVGLKPRKLIPLVSIDY